MAFSLRFWYLCNWYNCANISSQDNTFSVRAEKERTKTQTSYLYGYSLNIDSCFQTRSKRPESDLVAQNEEKNRGYRLLISFSKSTLLDYQLKCVPTYPWGWSAFPLFQREMRCQSHFRAFFFWSRSFVKTKTYQHQQCVLQWGPGPSSPVIRNKELVVRGLKRFASMDLMVQSFQLSDIENCVLTWVLFTANKIWHLIWCHSDTRNKTWY